MTNQSVYTKPAVYLGFEGDGEERGSLMVSFERNHPDDRLVPFSDEEVAIVQGLCALAPQKIPQLLSLLATFAYQLQSVESADVVPDLFPVPMEAAQQSTSTSFLLWID